MLVKTVNDGMQDIYKLELLVSEVSKAFPKPCFVLYGYCTYYSSRCLIAFFDSDSLDAAIAERSRLEGLLDAEFQERQKKESISFADMLGEMVKTEEETANEAEMCTDVEEVQNDLFELQGSVPLTGDDGDNHVAGDPVPADSGSADPLVNEPLDNLDPDPDVAVKDCTDCLFGLDPEDCETCPVDDLLSLALLALVGVRHV